MSVEVEHTAKEPATPAAKLSKPGIHRYGWLILPGLAVILGVQLFGAVRQWSITSDEINHLHAGYRYVTCGDFGWNPEHPPLLKMIAALPLRAMPINDPIPNACGMPNSKGIDFHAGHDFIFANSEHMLMLARAASSIFVFGLLVLVWFTARKMFGLATAMIVSVLLVFEPNVLAHGALVTTDVAASFGFLAAVVALYRHFETRHSFDLILTGLATGVALSLKHSCVLLVPALGAIAVLEPMLVPTSARTRAKQVIRNMAALACVGTMAFGVLWMMYGLRYSARPNGAQAWVNDKTPESHGLVATRIIPVLKQRHLLPEAYLNGLQDILVDPEVIPRPAFLVGHVYRGGRWFYFPVAALIKFSAVTLIFGLVSFFAFRFWKERRRQLLFLTIPAIVFLLVSCMSNLNMGIRHILPVLPLLMIFGAAGTYGLVSRYPKATLACAGVLILHAASSLHVYPNYISFSNEFWGGPSNTYRYLADSNVDWGQAMKEAKSYMDRHPAKSCWMIHSYNDTNQDFGIPCGETSEFKQEEPPRHLTGTLIITSNALDGILNYSGGSRTAAMFRTLTPKAQLGGSALFVYEGDFDLSGPLATYHAAQSARLLISDMQTAIREAQEATAFDPRNHIAHFVMCLAADKLGDRDRAERECNVTLKLVTEDPNVLADRAGIIDYMKSRDMQILGQ
jgi:hypothetical protein